MATKFNTTWLSTRQTDLPVPASTFGQNVGSAFRKGRSVNLIPLAFDAIKAKTSLGDETLLSEDQWNKSVYYRQGLEWTEGMTVERADSMARTFDIESVHANIYKRSSGFNKFSNWVSEYGTMFIADEVNFIPFLGTAYKGLSVGKAMYKAAKVGAAAGGAYGLAEGLLYKYGAAEMRGMPEPTWGLYSTDEDGNTQLGVAGMTAGGIALGGIFGAGLVGGGRALQSIFSKKKVLPDTPDVRETVDTNFNLKEQLQNGPLYYKDGFQETNPTVADYGYKLKQDGSIEVEILDNATRGNKIIAVFQDLKNMFRDQQLNDLTINFKGANKYYKMPKDPFADWRIVKDADGNVKYVDIDKAFWTTKLKGDAEQVPLKADPVKTLTKEIELNNAKIKEQEKLIKQIGNQKQLLDQVAKLQQKIDEPNTSVPAQQKLQTQLDDINKKLNNMSNFVAKLDELNLLKTKLQKDLDNVKVRRTTAQTAEARRNLDFQRIFIKRGKIVRDFTTLEFNATNPKSTDRLANQRLKYELGAGNKIKNVFVWNNDAKQWVDIANYFPLASKERLEIIKARMLQEHIILTRQYNKETVLKGKQINKELQKDIETELKNRFQSYQDTGGTKTYEQFIADIRKETVTNRKVVEEILAKDKSNIENGETSSFNERSNFENQQADVSISSEQAKIFANKNLTAEQKIEAIKKLNNSNLTQADILKPAKKIIKQNKKVTSDELNKLVEKYKNATDQNAKDQIVQEAVQLNLRLRNNLAVRLQDPELSTAEKNQILNNAMRELGILQSAIEYQSKNAFTREFVKNPKLTIDREITEAMELKNALRNNDLQAIYEYVKASKYNYKFTNIDTARVKDDALQSIYTAKQNKTFNEEFENINELIDSFIKTHGDEWYTTKDAEITFKNKAKNDAEEILTSAQLQKNIDDLLKKYSDEVVKVTPTTSFSNSTPTLYFEKDGALYKTMHKKQNSKGQTVWDKDRAVNLQQIVNLIKTTKGKQLDEALQSVEDDFEEFIKCNIAQIIKDLV